MATEVKRDIIGSSLFQTESDFGSQAERKVFVRLDPGDAFTSDTLIGKAIEKAIDGQFAHPEDPSLPLKEARGIQIGKDSAEITLRYRRSNTPSGPLDVPGGQSVVSTWRSTLVPFEAHYTSESFHPRYKGVPTGGFGEHINEETTPADQLPISHPRNLDEVEFHSVASVPTNRFFANDFNERPAPRNVFIQESDIQVPAVLNKDQFARLQTEVLPLIGDVNANNITNFGGLGFDIGELRLVGIDNDWVNQRSLGAQGFVNELTFAVNYKFKFRYGGHIREELFFGPTVRTNGNWDTRYVSLGRYSVFENFPV